MKKLFLSFLISSIVAGGICISCKKEPNQANISRNTDQQNHPPVAKAGVDQKITLPANSVMLDGSKSADPDKNITGYLWTKISGPSSFTVANANAVQTQVSDLVKGVYQFELKATDAGGLFSKDTVQVTVIAQPAAPPCDNSDRPIVTAQLVSVGTLPQPRIGTTVASAGNKILFAGGIDASGNPSSRVDIYDITSNTWSIAKLCVERNSIAAVSSGNKIIFGGGENGDGTWPVDSVDIYDVTTNTWSVSHLSCPGNSIKAAAVGNKAFFAGGDPGFAHKPGFDRTRQVDIYDLTTGLWSAIHLSDLRAVANHQVVVVNNKVFFTGFIGTSNEDIQPTSEIEVYDITTDTWSVDHLQEIQSPSAGIAIGNKILWVDVSAFRLIEGSCRVEIRDVVTNSSSIQYLHKPVMGQVAVAKDNKVLIFSTSGDSRDSFDIYDPDSGTWSIGALPQSMHNDLTSIISVNNSIYIVGSGVSTGGAIQVWKLAF